jgi:hypothetical protein
MKFADLHIHTNFSDSTLSPQEVIQYAHKNNLAAVAITDHDCVDGIEPAIKEALPFNIEVIPGIELTAEIDQAEVHILGYLIDYKQDWFIKKLDEIRSTRVKRIYAMVDKLKTLGVNIQPEEVFELARGSVGRLHLARVLKNDGFVSSLKEAFDNFLGEQSPAYVARFRLSPKGAIEIISRLSGISVLAHPSTMGKDELIPQLVEHGLDGIEVYYPEQAESVTKYYENLANKYNLLITGGSDCHGLARGEILMGRFKIPYELVEKLKDVRDRISNKRDL